MAHGSRSRSVLAGVLRASEWLVLVLIVGAVLVAVVVPRVAGATPYAVLSGSMEPAMPPGTLVIVRDADPASIAVGDVITFMPHENDPSVVTHRVIGVGVDMSGAPTFTTKGDANPVADVTIVRDYQLVGERWYFVPYLGWIVEALTVQQRAIGIYLVAGALILYALVMFAGAFRDRVRRSRVEHA
jgi:signal peptidase I